MKASEGIRVIPGLPLGTGRDGRTLQPLYPNPPPFVSLQVSDFGSAPKRLGLDSARGDLSPSLSSSSDTTVSIFHSICSSVKLF